MNKAITDGVQLMPPPFADGLNVWSSGDGTPGSASYNNAPNAAHVPADQDFGGALELQKTAAVQRLRYKGETPIIPGCYLRITARIKAISGNLPNVRISGFPAQSNGNLVPGVPQAGPEVALTTYGEVVEISAIVGIGARGGVDMVWGPTADYGHFGIDLTGGNGGVVRIDDIVIEDITSAFLQDLVATVDVVDYGAVGDGVTDDTAAFERADNGANGRTVLVPPGVFRLNGNVTFDNPTRFEGRVTMPASAVLLLRRNYDFPAYMDAFEDEETAFRKGFQALLNNVDHESFDLGGRKIRLTAPIDMQAAVHTTDRYATRRIIRNGQLEADSNGAWDTTTVSSQATYSPGNARTLSNVVNVASVPVGALVQGNGVGREVYVRSKNVSAQTITLNAPLYDAEGTQNYTFHRFKYLLDFSGFESVSQFGMEGIEFQCNNIASCVMLPPLGKTFVFKDCFFSRPRSRAITSIGGACQGMLINACQFLSSQEGFTVAQRTCIGLNTNANDVKIKNCRATQFRHFAVITGDNTLFKGNHFFQGDSVTDGVRTAGLVLANNQPAAVISGNYIDNCHIEWTNEHDPDPSFTGGFSFGSLSVTDNVFLSGDVTISFSYLVVKPYGAGHFLNGLNVTGNVVRSINGGINRFERVLTSFANLNHSRNKNVNITGNTYTNVLSKTANPVPVTHTQNTPAAVWTLDLSGDLAFEALAMNVESVVVLGTLRNAANVEVFAQPSVRTREGSSQKFVELVWSAPVKGSVRINARIDAPA